jgi:arylamine N-acetyltransferase
MDREGTELGSGGSCSLNNSFLGTVMRSLGMRVKSTGARVSKASNGGPKGRFDGWNHVIDLVWFDGEWYLVGVGFGINGPTKQMELVDGKEVGCELGGSSPE